MNCFQHQTTERKDTIRNLLNGIWRVLPPEPKETASLTWDEADAYFKHYLKLLQDRRVVDGISISFSNTDNAAEEVIRFVQFVRERWDQPVEKIEDDIRNDPPPFLLKSTHDATRMALKLALRLWLFVDPNLSDSATVQPQPGQTSAGLQLHQAVSSSLWPRSSPSLKTLSADFSAKSLIRKGGFEFQSTGDLSEHLTFDPDCRWIIRVFGCARALEVHRLSEKIIVYPEAFVVEVQKTLQLLFPTAGRKSGRRTREYVKRYRADLEAPIVEMNRLSLGTYPFFGERLEHIQKRYNDSTQRLLRQWYYDRRKRVEWATFVVAVIVFILTVVFGIISSVTGILQVYAAYKWHN
ncbi:uncharacterized protein A1O5_10584 [Cladophialophora psammophila CBS 110553]|uniref:Uncharacterized protein n=1 Tax=Cladophialophora psammophila CBS 110553 TaxID=1182543 RepID=W9WE96_9EURO|nr:uncharacterized protein A1O5_10584 [Cladophialophora psammophila CBS 110553]EXJ66432.1 hypothetical protein A1O5_10584 [Cladophialophora psammophila CBS 110553]